MTWVAVAVGVGGAVVGAVASSSAASKAASAQQNAANTASNTQLSMYNQTRTDQAPWRSAGGTAVGQLSAGTAAGGQFDQTFDASKFQTDPGYQFRLAQGEAGVENSAAARGGLLSGAALKGIDQYNQGFASNEYQNAYNRFNNDQSSRYNRLASIAGLGQTATGQTGQAGSYAANGIANAQIGAGNAAAAGYVGQANAVNSGASSLGNYYMQQQYLNRTPNYNTGSTGYATATPIVANNGTGVSYNPESGQSYCDYHLKEQLERIRIDQGSLLPVYDFWYIGQDHAEPKWRGYVAQDVLERYPDAVSVGPRGFLMVDHAKVPGGAGYPMRVPDESEWPDLQALS